jgi:hypothetical protein
MWEEKQLDRFAQLTKKRIKSGITDAPGGEDAYGKQCE